MKHHIVIGSILCILVIFSGCIEDVVETGNVTTYTNISNYYNNTTAFSIEVNNTNLAPTIDPSEPGTGERVGNNTTYWANNTPIELFIWAHAMTPGDIAELHLYINDTKVQDVSGKPLGAAEQNNKSLVAIIPRYAKYNVEIVSSHHYVWYEYKVISGTSTSTSTISQAFYKYDYVISNTTGTIQVYNTSSNSFLAGSYTPKSAIEATQGNSILMQGRYNVSSQINITASNTKIECTDNTPNLFLNDNVNASMFYVTSNNFEISHCNVDMNGANNAFPLNIEGAVYLVNANGTKIHDNNFSSDNYPVGDDGSLIYADFTSYNNSIVNNILTGGRNNIFAYNYNTIQGNIMSGGSHTCIYLRSGRYNTVTGNTCEYASSGVGIEGDETSDAYGNIVSNNVFYTMTGGSGVAIINTTGNSIVGNTCDQIQFNCIRITGSSNNTVISNTGNHMSKTTSSNQGGIYLINNSGAPSSNNTIASNTMIGPGQEYGVLIANPTVNPGNKIFLNNVISSSLADYGGLTLGNQAYFYYNGTCFISSNDAGAACI